MDLGQYSFIIVYQTNETQTANNMTTLKNLTSGTLYSISVVTVGPMGYQSTPVTAEISTKPERVRPVVSSRGTNDTIEVTWTSPSGNVEQYMVNLISDSGENQTKVLNSSFESHSFIGLTAGRNYTVVVTTISGPFAEESEPVSNATYPNPPGAILVEEQTTDFITISWGLPQDMDLGQYSFIIVYQTNETQTANNMMTLKNLTSGTLYSISVVTVGPMGYQSTPLTAEISTKQYMVNLISDYGDNQTKVLNSSFESHSFIGLTAGRNYTVVVTTISGPFAEESEPVSNATYPNPPGAILVEEQTTDFITISWGLPQDMDLGQYSFIIVYQTNETQTANNMTTLKNLTSGTLYSISVVTVGPMGYQSTPVTAEISTKPERVRPVVSSRGTNDTIEVTWTSPSGNVEQYMVNLISDYGDNQTKVLNSSFESHSFIGLTAGRNYTVVVTTISGPFAEESEPVSNATYPNPPGAILVEEQTTDFITISWGWPQDMDLGQYSFIIVYQTNETQTANNMMTLKNLTSGTLYSISVITVGPMGYQSTPVTAEISTKPERVRPVVSSRGTNDTIEVTWTSPSGNVEQYMVNLISDYGDNQTKVLNSSFESHSFIGLTAGRNYTVVVTTISGPFAEESEPVSNATYPNPPGAILVEEQTTDFITISWGLPQDMDLGQYSFIIVYQTNETQTANNMTTLKNLTSGTLYSISVVTVGPMGYQSTPVTAEISTKPERARPVVSSRGTNDTIEVTWTSPSGNVEQYMVNLISDYGDNQTKVLNSSFESHSFIGLTAGRNYTVVVTTISGPFAEESEPVSNATYPNPPGAILVEEQTTDFITISWGWPQDMDLGQYSFIIVYQTNETETANNMTTLKNLTSGTLYSISVVTVGPMGYQSTPVTADISTKQYMVNLISDYGDNQTKVLNSSFESHSFIGLTAGRNYTVVVTTISGPFAEESEPVSNATYPNPPGAILVEEQTTDFITISWGWPQDMDLGQYSFIIVYQTNKTETANNMTTLKNLTSGTLYSISVVTVGPMGYQSTPVTAEISTKPERVRPVVSSRGTNDTIEVTWTSPSGNVEQYMVNLISDYGDNQTKVLNSSFESHSFIGLTAGRNYTVVVTTISGPFAEESEPVSNATYPNPPGAILVEEQTTDFITISWGWPQGMDLGQYSFIIVYQTNETQTANNMTTLKNLTSGTLYSISVVTVGPMGYQSTPVTAEISTRPESVRGLKVSSTSVNMINITWQEPVGLKPGYSYRATIQSSAYQLGVSITELHYEFTRLVPGNRYNLEVTSQTSDGTEGSPMSISVCTDTSPVNFTCVGPNRTGPLLNLAWDSPEGSNDGFWVTWSENGSATLPACTGSCSHSIEDLSYHTPYSVHVWTLGCGKSSSVSENVCQTGITAPPELNPDINVVVEKQHDGFTLKFDSSVLNGKNGPITAYGILLTSNLNGFSEKNNSGLRKYLDKTYNDWTGDNSVPYLATAREIDTGQNRNEESELVVEVGSGSDWNGYHNGPLKPVTTYRYALVMFTHVVIKDELVDVSESLFSVSPFSANDVDLPQNPGVITAGAVAGTLAVITALAVGAAVYWRRAAKKRPTEIPIEAMRGFGRERMREQCVCVPQRESLCVCSLAVQSVSRSNHSVVFSCSGVPVQVVEYEVYHKKQSADSNCGFAEQYEDLRSVGIAQSKTSATDPENKGKNRYSNVLPYDASRVKLSVQGSQFDDYINASYIPGYNCKKEYIAAQGPLPGTVDEFWRMLWEKNVRTLVMLTRCNEMGRVKCEEYWPSDTKHYKNIAVTTTSIIPLEDWTIRDFDVKNVKTAETRNLRQFHFTAWPDHGVPESTELLINFRHLVREHMEQHSRNSPTVVHCSAGVGRTGTMIAIDHLIFQIERESMVDLYAIVHSMRMHRGLMVQTEEQYVFLHRCALDIIKSRTGTNVDLIYQNTAAMDIYENFKPGGAGAV
ncbi:receptor-type tyrosine-protein phosphatase eta-like [Conger conger]|uniref:receptor-type tyrosine-protein phosphatase eta-like n=1 Tax=Conger conger TaxID=82655 RepID=UPI002A5AE91B|nr:receptor-type tyrosine-protein phosphatase eta-like [Conger conger]